MHSCNSPFSSALLPSESNPRSLFFLFLGEGREGGIVAAAVTNVFPSCLLGTYHTEGGPRPPPSSPSDPRPANEDFQPTRIPCLFLSLSLLSPPFATRGLHFASFPSLLICRDGGIDKRRRLLFLLPLYRLFLSSIRGTDVIFLLFRFLISFSLLFRPYISASSFYFCFLWENDVRRRNPIKASPAKQIGLFSKHR